MNENMKARKGEMIGPFHDIIIGRPRNSRLFESEYMKIHIIHLFSGLFGVSNWLGLKQCA